MVKDNILWIFIHPIRSGGVTLFEFIKKNAQKEEIFLVSEARYNFKDFQRFDPKKTRFILGHATYYGIHNLAQDKEPRYFIFLRDPAERIVSYYNSKMGKDKKRIPFSVWYKNQEKNDLVNFLDLKYRGSESSRIHTPKIFIPILRKLNYRSFFFLQTLALKFLKIKKNYEKKKLENAKKLLDACWFIRILGHDEDKDFNFLIKEMGFKDLKWEKKTGLTKNILKVTPELRKKIYKDNPLDVEIYEYALKLKELKKEKRFPPSR